MTLDFEELAREAREQVRPGEPRLDAITTARHRRGLLVLGAAVAVAVVIGAVAVWPHHGSRPAPGSPAPIPGTPHPNSAGWVAAGSVMLRVPRTWADSQYGCETDPRPAVVYDPEYWSLCQDTSLGRQRRPASLWVLPTHDAIRGYGGFAYVKAHHAVPRLGARRSPVFGQGGDDGHYWYQALVVPAAHTMFIAQAPSRDEVRLLIASARRVPSGSVAPPAVAGEDLSAARAALQGYDVRVHEVRGYYRAGSVIDSDPAFGTPLRPGSAVTLTVSVGLGSQPVMSDAFLARHEVHVEPLGEVTPAERRRIAQTRAALVARMSKNPSVWVSQLVLRRITATYPSRHGVPEFQHRLAWLWLTPRALVPSLGGPCCGPAPPGGLARDISVYDALTGAFITGSTF